MNNIIQKISKGKIWLFYLSVIFTILFLVVAEIFPSDEGLETQEEESYMPEEGYVPNAETAIKIAEAIWLPIYGKEIYKSKPFVAELSKDKKVWKVEGSLPPETVGGTPYAEIRKRDCKVLKVIHGE